MNIVEHIVTYKTGPKEPQLEDKFLDKQVAIAFAFDIEVNGGIAILTSRVKHTPQGQDFVESAPMPRFVRRP